jgi:hypothetical protein
MLSIGIIFTILSVTIMLSCIKTILHRSTGRSFFHF